MSSRRDLILGAASLVAAGAAYQLTPRHHVSLLGNRRMDTVIPSSFGSWQSQGDVELVQPVERDSLVAKLYSQTVSRIYFHAANAPPIMMLVAYGDNQSDLLQLHRPESCYPAVGFRLIQNDPTSVELGGGVAIPGRQVVAERSERREVILYWTRLGEFLPISGSEQREARLATALKGEIADGALFRCSTVGLDDAAAFTALRAFVAELVRAVSPADRPVLLGTSRARALRQA